MDRPRPQMCTTAARKRGRPPKRKRRPPPGSSPVTPAGVVGQRRGVAIVDVAVLAALLSLGTAFAVGRAHSRNVTLGAIEWAFWYLSIAWTIVLTRRWIERIAVAA